MANPLDSSSLSDRIAERIRVPALDGMAMTDTAPSFTSMGDVMEFAKVMAVSQIGVRKHLRDNVGACVAVCLQASRWRLDPFMVANRSYLVNDQIAYESALIAAVVNTRAPIRGRLKTRFTGDGDNRRCIVSGTFVGEAEPTEVESPPIGRISPKNSPLWKTDPDQQLAYYTKRLWARREVPELLLGAYDLDEAREAAMPPGPDHARDITPPRPKRSDFVTASVEAPLTADEDAEADRLARRFAETGEITEDDDFDGGLSITATIIAGCDAAPTKADFEERRAHAIDALADLPEAVRASALAQISGIAARKWGL